MSPRIPPQRAKGQVVGITADRAPNVLHYGDCLTVLRERIAPESVDLVYLDPPFNSQRAYNMIFKEHGGVAPNAQLRAFGDTWIWDERARDTLQELRNSPRTPLRLKALLEGLDGAIHASEMMAYVSMMAIRIMEMHRVLKPTGSLYLHCDPTASHYLKLVLDAVFGPERFLNELMWKRSSAHSGSRKYSPVHDTILLYAKSDNYIWNSATGGLPQKTIDQWYNNVEEGTGRRFNRADLTGSGTRGGSSGKSWRGKNPTEKGRHWAIPGFVRELVPDLPKKTQEALDRLDAIGRIHWPEKVDGMPMFKRYLEEAMGVPLLDVIVDIPPLNNSTSERLGYPTQKPLKLLERLIEASSDEDHVVLDPFCGCGTTIDAAQKLKRRWIGIDITHLAIGVIEQRMKVRHPGVQYDVRGLPEDAASAQMLATDDKFGFQAWAVLKIAARPMGLDFAGRAKRGADQGLDGILTFAQSPDGKDVQRMIVSVKGGVTGAGDVRDLLGVVNTSTNKAVMGILICATGPTKAMKDAALDAGMWYSQPWGKEYPRIQILSVADLFNGELPKHPGTNVTFAIAETMEKDQEQIVIPGMGVDGLSPAMAERQQRRKPKRSPKGETIEIAFPDKKTTASRTARAGKRRR